MTIKEVLLLFLTAMLLPAGWSIASDWPNWRGPYLNGSSDEKNLPATWSKTENIAWTFDGPSPDCSTPLLYKGNLYVLADRKGGVITCLDARTGRQKWQGKLGGTAPWWASITAGDDKLYCISEAAEAVVLAAGDEGFKVLHRIEMGDKPIQASIAIADGHLFIRTASKLFCVGN